MTTTPTENEEFVTIIAPSTGDAMRQFKAQGLDRQGFAIAGRVGQHRFSLVSGTHADDPFPGQSLVAATFSRRVPA